MTAVAVAVNVPDVAFAGTVTEVGTLTAALLLARLTTSPPAGAGAPKLTVHASLAAPVMELAAQEMAFIPDVPDPLILTVMLPVEELLDALPGQPVDAVRPVALILLSAALLSGCGENNSARQNEPPAMSLM